MVPGTEDAGEQTHAMSARGRLGERLTAVLACCYAVACGKLYRFGVTEEHEVPTWW